MSFSTFQWLVQESEVTLQGKSGGWTCFKPRYTRCSTHTPPTPCTLKLVLNYLLCSSSTIWWHHLQTKSQISSDTLRIRVGTQQKNWNQNLPQGLCLGWVLRARTNDYSFSRLNFPPLPEYIHEKADRRGWDDTAASPINKGWMNRIKSDCEDRKKHSSSLH